MVREMIEQVFRYNARLRIRITTDFFGLPAPGLPLETLGLWPVPLGLQTVTKSTSLKGLTIGVKSGWVGFEFKLLDCTVSATLGLLSGAKLGAG